MTESNTSADTTAVPAVNADAAAGQGTAVAAGETDGATASGGAAAEGTEGTASGTEGEPVKTEGDPPKDDATADQAGEDAPLSFKVPEGIEVTPEWQAEITTLAKTIETMPVADRGQAIVDAGVKFEAQIRQHMVDEHTRRVEAWAVQTKADPVVGGSNFDANTTVALSAISKFGDPELTQVLADYGLGNHPAVVRAFYRIGKAAGESGNVHGLGGDTPAPRESGEAALARRMSEAANKPTARKPG